MKRLLLLTVLALAALPSAAQASERQYETYWQCKPAGKKSGHVHHFKPSPRHMKRHRCKLHQGKPRPTPAPVIVYVPVPTPPPPCNCPPPTPSKDPKDCSKLAKERHG